MPPSAYMGSTRAVRRPPACARPRRRSRDRPPSPRSALRTSGRGNAERSRRRRDRARRRRCRAGRTGARRELDDRRSPRGRAASRRVPGPRSSTSPRSNASPLWIDSCNRPPSRPSRGPVGIIRRLETRKDSMNILVTGGAGFIGSHMARRHLADGHRVVIVDNLSTGRREKVPGGRAVRPGRHRRDRPRAAPAGGEDRLRLAPRGADRRAAQRVGSPLRRAVEHPRVPEALRGVQARGREARPLLDGRGPLRRARGRPAGDESHPTNPISPYGCAKLSIEKYLYYYQVIHGFQTQVFRYANVYGPGQNGLGEAGVVAIFCEAILHGRTPKIRGDGNQTRDYVFVMDLVRAPRRPRSRRTAAAPGTWAPGSRPRSTSSSRRWRRP